MPIVCACYMHPCSDSRATVLPTFPGPVAPGGATSAYYYHYMPSAWQYQAPKPCRWPLTNLVALVHPELSCCHRQQPSALVKRDSSEWS
jgi:hypothetical protein